MFQTPEFWVLVSFVLFIAVVARKGWAVITDILDRRSAAIRAEIEEARQLKEEAQALLADYRRRQRDAAQETEAIISRAREQAERHRAQAQEALERTLARRREQALDKIAQAEADAIREVRSLAVDIAMSATRQVIAERLSEESANALVDESIRQIPQKLH